MAGYDAKKTRKKMTDVGLWGLVVGAVLTGVVAGGEALLGYLDASEGAWTWAHLVSQWKVLLGVFAAAVGKGALDYFKHGFFAPVGRGPSRRAVRLPVRGEKVPGNVNRGRRDGYVSYRVLLVLVLLCALACAMALQGCATTHTQDFTNAYIDAEGNWHEDTFSQKARTGAFSQQDIELAGMRWQYGDGQLLEIGQQGVHQDNSGQVEAVTASAAVVSGLGETVLARLGPPPLDEPGALPAWMELARALLGGDQGLLQQVVGWMLSR